MLADTDEAVVAPARSQSRWKTGRATFSPLRGSAIAPVTTTVLPASGAPDTTSGGRSSSRTSRSTPSSRRRAISARVLSRARCEYRLAATFGPMSSTCCRASSPASATSSRLRYPARQRRVAAASEAIGIAMPISARRSPTPRLAPIDSSIRSADTSAMPSNASRSSRPSA